MGRSAHGSGAGRAGAGPRAGADGVSENRLRVRCCLASSEGLSVFGRRGGPLCCSSSALI